MKKILYKAGLIYTLITGSGFTALHLLSSLQQRALHWQEYGGVLLVCLLVYLLFVLHYVKYIGQLNEQTRAFAKGDLTAKVPNFRNDELGELSDSLQSMAEKLTQSMQQTLREKGQMETILASMAEGVLAFDSTGKLLLINRTAEEMLNVSGEEVREHYLLEFLPNHQLAQLLKKCITTGQELKTDLHLFLDDADYYEVYITPIKGEGNNEGKQVNHVINQEINRYVFHDRKLDADDADFLLPQDELSGERKIDELIYGEGDEANNADRQQKETVVQNQAEKGNIFPQGTVMVLRNVTKLRQLEQMRSEFIANVSHELRTPLTLIKGFVETILDGAREDRELTTKFLTIINNETDRLNTLISDLLFLSQLESGDMEIVKRKIDSRVLVDKIITLLQPVAQSKNIRMESEFKLGAEYFYASEEMIEQVLINLVDNAIKYSFANGVVKIMVKPYREKIRASESTGQEKIAIEVTDQGMGIPSHSIPRLFERFYRVDKARSRQVGGTGLGLSIVKHIVERHQGKVLVRSQENQGATFIIILPKV
jgi:signal transduction histidine kinase